MRVASRWEDFKRRMNALGGDRHALRGTTLQSVIRFAIMLKSFWPAR